jgi:hypothetical protein
MQANSDVKTTSRPTFSREKLSIARLMMIITLIAANCALIREIPSEIGNVPPVWIVLGVIDYLILWKLILRRPFRAPHYSFLVVFVIGSVVLMNQVAMERIHPMGPLVRWYPQVVSDHTRKIMLTEIAHLGDFWMAGAIAFLIALGGGRLAGWLERRRGWDIAAFFRGALIGFGIANLYGLLIAAISGPYAPGSVAHNTTLAVLAACVILGGRLGLSRLKSKELDGTTPGPKPPGRPAVVSDS